MRKLAFIISLLGLFSLFLILTLSKPSSIDSPEQLKELTQNQLVYVQGVITKQNQDNKQIILTLNNNITLTYSDKYYNFQNQNISAIGIYDNFLYDKIKVLKIYSDDI